MTRQLTFDLPSKTALGREDFFVSEANASAVEFLGNWESWSGGKMLLVGPAGSGKTHLTHVWAGESDAVVISATDLREDRISGLVSGNRNIAVEDVDLIAGQSCPEQNLFHLHNLVLAEGGRLLMTAATPPGMWNFAIADLASRVKSAGLARLLPPDEMLLSVVLVKLFTDRQLVVKPVVISYLVSRMTRSFDVAGRLVEALDQAALAEKRAITTPLATRVLKEISAD